MTEISVLGQLQRRLFSRAVDVVGAELTVGLFGRTLPNFGRRGMFRRLPFLNIATLSVEGLEQGVPEGG